VTRIKLDKKGVESFATIVIFRLHMVRGGERDECVRTKFFLWVVVVVVVVVFFFSFNLD